MSLFERALESSYVYVHSESPWELLQVVIALWLVGTSSSSSRSNPCCWGCQATFRGCHTLVPALLETTHPSPSFAKGWEDSDGLLHSFIRQDAGEIRLPLSGTLHLGCGHRGFPFLWRHSEMLIFSKEGSGVIQMKRKLFEVCSSVVQG